MEKERMKEKSGLISRHWWAKLLGREVGIFVEHTDAIFWGVSRVSALDALCHHVVLPFFHLRIERACDCGSIGIVVWDGMNLFWCEQASSSCVAHTLLCCSLSIWISWKVLSCFTSLSFCQFLMSYVNMDE